jgi:hypothetical protein
MENLAILLPAWLIGTPLVFAIVDFARTPKVTRGDETHLGVDGPVDGRIGSM